MSWGNTAEFEKFQLRPTLVERVLSFLFPPKFGKVEGFASRPEFNEEGWAGNVRVKKYRDGIDRVEKEGI